MGLCRRLYTSCLITEVLCLSSERISYPAVGLLSLLKEGKDQLILSHLLRRKEADSVHSVPGMSIPLRQKLWHSDLLTQRRIPPAGP